MSTPTTKVTDSAPRRGRFPRFRDFRVRSKLGLILAVPITAIVTLTAINLVDSGQRAVVADNVNSLAQLSADASDLIHHVQSERTAAVNLLTKYSDVPSYKAQYNGTDVAADAYKSRRNGLGDLGPSVMARLKPVDDALARLPELRAEVAKGKGAIDGISLDNAVSRYGYLIDDLLAFRDVVWQTSDDSGVTDEVRAASAFSRAKEYAAKEQTIILGLGVGGQAGPAEFRRYQVSTAGQQEALREFYNAATPAQRNVVETMVRGTAIQKVESMEGMLNEAMATKSSGIQVPEWIQATSGKLEQMRAAEQQLDKLAVTTADVALNIVRRQVIFEAALVLATLLVAVVLALIVARSMVRSLRQLREAAIGVAYQELPKAVARLRDPEIALEANPETIAAQLDDPLQVRGRDEFGQVAQAFNVVHREAVRVAAEQAVLRANVSTMFVNLARRSQTLVDRLIGHLDRLEKGEEDPDRLAALFQLDHLATRMRRNDENLLVLAGADSTRIQRDPAPLGDVLRAAQSEVEHYTRIEFGVIERDIEIIPHAINDLVHLIAELFDNATAFSAPDTAIVVDARRVGDRAVVQVEDRGIGISTDQLEALNERLANPPLVDVAVSRMMGLVVVARLGHRHAIRVELQPAREHGVVAQVLLPADILAGESPRGNTRNTPTMLPAPASPLALDNAPARGNVGSLFGSTPTPVPVSGATSAGYADEKPSQAPGVLTSFGNTGVPGPQGGSAPRPVPAWHDLTGAATSPGTDSEQSTGWLPVRRPGATVDSSGEGTNTSAAPSAHRENTIDAEVVEDASGQVIPRQLPSSPEVPPTEASQTSLLGLVAPSLQVAPHALPGQAQPDTTSGMPRVTIDPADPAALDLEVEPGESAESGDPVEPTENGENWEDGEDHALEARREHVVPTSVTSAGQSPATEIVETAKSVPADPEGSESETSTSEVPNSPVPTTVSVPSKPLTPKSLVADVLTSGIKVDDDGEELLIFREMESVWFSTGREAPGSNTEPEPWSFGYTPKAEKPRSDVAGSVSPSVQSAASARSLSQTPATVDASAPAQEAYVVGEHIPPSTRISSIPAASQTPLVRVSPTPPPAVASGERWQTIADRGWQAASAAAAPSPAGTTDTGLPKRVPMAQLVPGGVAAGSTTVDKRNPEAVRGLLSAYHRGVQRGRQRPSGETEPGQFGVGEVNDQAGHMKTTQHTQNGPGKERNA